MTPSSDENNVCRFKRQSQRGTVKPENCWSDELYWWISSDEVDRYCEANDEPPLSEAEMEDLFHVFWEDLDTYEVIGEAISRLRRPEDWEHELQQ